MSLLENLQAALGFLNNGDVLGDASQSGTATASLECVEGAATALCEDLVHHRDNYDYASYSAIWDIVSQIWDACVVASHNDKDAMETDTKDRTHPALLQVACALCNVIPEKFQNDEVKTGIIRIKAKTSKQLIELREFEKANMRLGFGSSDINFLRQQLSHSFDEYHMEQLALLITDICVIQFQTAIHLNQDPVAVVRLMAAVINEGSIPSELASELCCQFCQTVLRCIVAKLPWMGGNESESPDYLETMPFLDQLLSMLGIVSNAQHTVKQEVNHLQRKTLAVSCLCSLQMQDNESAWNKLIQLKDLRDSSSKEHGETEDMQFEDIVAFQVLLQIGQIDEAEKELLNAMSNAATGKMTCLQLLAECAKHNSPFIEAAVNILQQRFANDADLLLKVASMVLDKDQVTDAEDHTVLQILAPGSAHSIVAFQDLRSDAFTLLWNRGVDHFQKKAYTKATAFFEASYGFCVQDQLAKTIRALALCLVAIKDYTRGAEWMTLRQSMPGNRMESADCFIGLKIALLQSDDESAIEAMHQLSTCCDFTPDVLKIACQEAMANKRYKVARTGLLKIHEATIENRIVAQGTTEALILRLLIKCVLDEAECKSGITDDLVAYYELVVKRLDEDGFESFFGTSSGNLAFPELEWFADQAWNAAIHASKNAEYKAASTLFSASAIILSLHPLAQSKHKLQTQAAYLRGAMAALDEFDQHPDFTLNVAKNMIKCAKAIKQTKEYDNEDLLLCLEFGIAGRSKQQSALVKILEKCRLSMRCTGRHIIKLSSLVKEGPYKDDRVCTLALSIALQKLLNETPLQFNEIAAVRRTIIQLCADDTEKLNWYKEALKTLQVHRFNIAEFPDKELKWLVTSCWNHGCHYARFRRFELAKEHMQIAIGMADFCSEMRQRTQKMKEDLKNIQLESKQL